MKFEITDDYRNRLAMYLESFDVNVDRDLLEVDIYDEDYMKECFVNFQNSAEAFYQKCKKENRNDLWFRYNFEWQQVKWRIYYSEMVKIIDTVAEDTKNELFAYQKFSGYCSNRDPFLTFGKKIGRSNDRYDYFMYLKCGISYQPKYITKQELIKILKENKYGYSAHCIL